MRRESTRRAMGWACVVAFALSGAGRLRPGPEAAASQGPKGTTARITQEMMLGDLSCEMNCAAYFMPPDRFRVEGKIVFKTMEMEFKMAAVGTGSEVRQLFETPMGPQAIVLDLERVRKEMPEYVPSQSYDPAAYRDLLKEMPDKRRLADATMDGVAVEGYEIDMKGRTPAIVSVASFRLPEPGRMRVWVSPKDGIARKVEVEDVNGDVFLRMTYRDVRTGVAIAGERFVLKFPKGVTPIDQTGLVLRAAAMRESPGAAGSQAEPRKGAEGDDKGGKR